LTGDGYSLAMDKNNNRKMRIATGQKAANDGAMSEETCDALFARAADLAYAYFGDATDDHIECVYARLVMNHAIGAGEAGAVTVH